MATKKAAAYTALGLAWDIFRDYGGDEEMDILVMRLLWLADDLDKTINQRPIYEKISLGLFHKQPSKLTKLRNLILHPGTPPSERENAVQMLDKLQRHV